MPFLRRGFLKSANRRNELYCSIDASPIAAIFFFFVGLFIVATIFVPPYRTASVDRVLARHAHNQPGALREDAIKIVILRDGRLAFGSSIVISSELPSKIHDALLGGAEKRIYLDVDARARYGDVKSVLSQIQIVGIQNVTILAESPRLIASRASRPTP